MARDISDSFNHDFKEIANNDREENLIYLQNTVYIKLRQIPHTKNTES